MKDNLTVKDVSQELIDAVAAYLTLRAEAETTRERVDAVQRRILTELSLYNDLMVEHGLPKERVLDPDSVYLSQDEAALSEFYGAVDARLREAGIKPPDMQLGYCPALVAEHERTKAEWALLDEAAKMLEVYEGSGQFNNALLGMGLEKRQEFIDLTCKMVMALPI